MLPPAASSGPAAHGPPPSYTPTTVSTTSCFWSATPAAAAADAARASLRRSSASPRSARSGRSRSRAATTRPSISASTAPPEPRSAASSFLGTGFAARLAGPLDPSVTGGLASFPGICVRHASAGRVGRPQDSWRHGCRPGGEPYQRPDSAEEHQRPAAEDEDHLPQLHTDGLSGIPRGSCRRTSTKDSR